MPEIKLKVKCPACGWNGEIKESEAKGNSAPTCPECYMDLIVNKAIIKKRG